MIFTKLNHELASRPKFVPTPEEVGLLNRALEMAINSRQRFRVGAAGIAGAYTCNTTDLHAEHRLVLQYEKSLIGRTVAVARLGRRNDWRCSYPCPNCATAMRLRGVEKIVCFNESGQPVSLEL